MSKEIYISSTPHETRLAIVEKDELSEIYYERENEYTLAGSIYNGRVTRVLPGMQSSFVDIGLERDAFLYITDFLEEQGDSADFESAGGAPREGRSDRGGNGEGRRERPGRASREGRSGEREDRGERDSRGERDDRNGREAGPHEGSAHAEFSLDPEGSFAPEGSGRAREAGGSDGAEPGTPEADGSRRWRGRRGRRRERGADEPQAAGSTPDAGDPLDAVQAADEGIAPPQASAPRSARSEGSSSEGSGDGSHSQARRDRGERGERGGRDFRRGRDASRDSRDNRREAGDPGEDRGAAAEPLILPGESLARYRRGEDGESTPQTGSAASSGHGAQPAALARPSTEFQLTAAWDGGATLPGESLSRHREAAPSSRPAGDRDTGFARRHEADSAGGGDRRRERDQRRGRRPDRPALDPIEAVQPAVTSQHEPEAAALPFSDEAPQFEIEATEERQEFEAARAEFEEPAAYEPQTDLAPAATEPSLELLEAVEEFHEVVSEYEPGNDASASYRVDPVAPSEFRQDSLVADDLDHLEARFSESEEGHLADAADHEFTAVQPSGEMISEDPLVPEAVANASLEAQLSAPIEHEAAVQSVHLGAAEAVPLAIHAALPSIESDRAQQPGNSLTDDHAAPDHGPSKEADDPRAFAPGSGALEEELMDDEDADPLSLGASASGFDDMEEETLEGAADLGVMLRDMAVDEITRPEPVDMEENDDDDFDLDMDDLEEDELDSSAELSGSDVSEIEEDEFAEAGELDDEAELAPGAEEGSEPLSNEARTHAGEGQPSRSRRGRGRRGVRDTRPEQRADEPRGRERAMSMEPKAQQSQDQTSEPGRERGFDRQQDRVEEPRDRRERPSRDGRRANGRSGGRMSRHTAQTTDLPAISDLLKPGQELLVQIAKEPIAKKGARITSHIALPGRFLVFMPTVKHVGVSRKIESDAERRRLKEILLSEKGEAQGGFIVRTAASGASEEELRSDLRFLLNLWTDIKQRSEGSKSPALIYHDLNLVERVLRDQVTDTFSAIWVDTEAEYERVLRFLQRFQPSLLRRVKLYTKDTPLFEQFGIAEEINKALRSKVWLKSGGSIVINQTEALVAIDINTGKYVGKTARLEDTIVKTNLDAIPEIVRQVRLRDLGGIIVIDFIDMDDRKNRHKVLAALEEELKKDRAPSKVLNFNDFGLVIITRKRVKQSLERTLSTTCNVCVGTGMTKSPVTVCNEIYIELRKMYRTLDKGDIMLRVNPEVVKALKSNNARWLTDLEELSGKTILLKSDPSLHPEQFDIH